MDLASLWQQGQSPERDVTGWPRRRTFKGGIVERNATGAQRFGDAVAHRHGVYFPDGYTVAVIDNGDEARTGARELVDAGFLLANVKLITGPEAIDMHNEQRRRAGLLDKVIGALPTDERSIENDYLMQASDGSSFVVFRSTSNDEETRARQILAGHGAHGMRHHGRWTWDDSS
jgi:hypothetical protein